MRYKEDNNNRYRVNFMRATEELMDALTVESFISYLEENAEFEDYTVEYIDGKCVKCRAYDLTEENSKLHKEFLVTEDGRVFYWSTESEIDALSLISYGVPAVAIMGSHISEDQCKELERTPFRRFVIATDNDDAGRKGASQIKRLLIPKGFRFINLKWHTSLKDINDLVKEYGDGWKDHLTGY